MRKTVFFLLVIMSLVLMGFDINNMENQAPDEVEGFAEENYRDFILDIINGSDEAAFNFTRGDQDVSLGKLIPENRLVIDKDMKITIKPPAKWVVPVYQSGVVRNAIDIWEPSTKKYEIAGIGYSGAFSELLAGLEPDEYFLHNMQYDFALAYAPSRDNIRPLGESSIRLFSQRNLNLKGISKEEFQVFVQQHLRDNYPDRLTETAEKTVDYLYAGIAFLLLVSALFLFKRIN